MGRQGVQFCPGRQQQHPKGLFLPLPCSWEVDGCWENTVPFLQSKIWVSILARQEEVAGNAVIVPKQGPALRTKPLLDSIIHAGDFYGQSLHSE